MEIDQEMKTVGEILKKAREEKGLGLDRVAAATRIKKRFLEAIEKNDFQNLPSKVAARGFVKNYADFLELSPKSVLAVFKRDFRIRRGKEVLPRGLDRVAERSKFNWTPKLTLLTTIVLVFFILAAYLSYQYLSLVKNPHLEVFQPQEDQNIFSGKVEVVGRTDPEVALTVNGNLVTLSMEGEFNSALILLPGENKIAIEATNKLGKKTTVERSVFRSDTER